MLKKELDSQFKSLEEKVHKFELDLAEFKGKDASTDRWFNHLKTGLAILNLVMVLFLATIGFIGFKTISEINAQIDAIKTKVSQVNELADKTIEFVDTTRDSIIGYSIEAKKLNSKSMTNLLAAETRLNKVSNSADSFKIVMNEEIAAIKKNILSLARIFNSVALRENYSNILSGREKALLFLLSWEIYANTNLPKAIEGLPAYNLAMILLQNNKPIEAKQFLIISSKLQTNLTESGKKNLAEKIAQCDRLINEQKLIQDIDYTGNYQFDPSQYAFIDNIRTDIILDELINLGYLNVDEYNLIQKKTRYEWTKKMPIK